MATGREIAQRMSGTGMPSGMPMNMSRGGMSGYADGGMTSPAKMIAARINPSGGNEEESDAGHTNALSKMLMHAMHNGDHEAVGHAMKQMHAHFDGMKHKEGPTMPSMPMPSEH